MDFGKLEILARVSRHRASGPARRATPIEQSSNRVESCTETWAISLRIQLHFKNFVLCEDSAFSHLWWIPRGISRHGFRSGCEPVNGDFFVEIINLLFILVTILQGEIACTLHRQSR